MGYCHNIMFTAYTEAVIVQIIKSPSDLLAAFLLSGSSADISRAM